MTPMGAFTCTQCSCLYSNESVCLSHKAAGERLFEINSKAETGLFEVFFNITTILDCWNVQSNLTHRLFLCFFETFLALTKQKFRLNTRMHPLSNHSHLMKRFTVKHDQALKSTLLCCLKACVFYEPSWIKSNFQMFEEKWQMALSQWWNVYFRRGAFSIWVGHLSICPLLMKRSVTRSDIHIDKHTLKTVSSKQTWAVISARDRYEALILLNSGHEITNCVNISFTSANPRASMLNICTAPSKVNLIYGCTGAQW